MPRCWRRWVDRVHGAAGGPAVPAVVEPPANSLPAHITEGRPNRGRRHHHEYAEYR